ncbi:MAG: type VII toxin-antitoxin system HepT family RNase toxin [Thermodesulfobacteriota bacterium]
MERIEQKKGRILEYVRLIKNIRQDCLERFDTDPIYRGALLHYLYLMADSCIALAILVIKQKALRPPQTYSEAFDILGANDIISPDFAYPFAKIAGFRNFLAHDYESVSGEQICNYLVSGLEEVEEYISRIEQAMK